MSINSNVPAPYGLHQSSVDYWGSNRNKQSDLYRSEEKYFIPAVNKSTSVLDLGCAAGGFSSIVHDIKADIKYTGIDVSETLISRAKISHKDDDYFLYDGKTIPKSIVKHDLAYSFGVLHHVDSWVGLVKQMYDRANKYVIFDLRLTREKTVRDINKSYQKIAFNSEWDQKTKVQYVINNMGETINELLSIITLEDSLSIYGYNLPPTDLAVTVYDEVIMASIQIEKETESPFFYSNISF